ncbi:MAG: folate family ECF transporter S component [Firmicutes bacterium]|nr:folate family ECF transporter S component [Bacillota bacterium]
MHLNTRTAANLSLLTAISVVLTRIFGVVLPIAGVGALRLSFGEIPLILAGILFGPWAGALAGLASDLVGYLVNAHGGAFFPGFAFSAALTGLLPGLLLHNRRAALQWWQVGSTVFLTDLVTGVFLNTLWLTILYGQGFFVILPARLGARLVTLPVYTITVFLLNRAYQAYLKSR